METNKTIAYMPPPPPTHVVVQPHVVTTVPIQTQVVTVRRSTYGAEKSVGLGVTEVILRVICVLFCLAVLIAASVTISAVNDVSDDYENDYYPYREYEHADDYSGAAGWLVLVAVVALVYHGIAVFIRILYYAPSIGRFYSGFSITNAILSILFGLAFLAGAISNSVYASDNIDLYYELDCDYYYDYYSHNRYYFDVCDDLERVYSSQASSATFAFLSMVMFIPIFIITLVGGIRKIQEVSNTRSDVLTTPYVHLPN